MTDKIDIGWVVERALALQKAAEMQEHLAQIREAEKSVDDQLKGKGEDPRASVIAIAGELGIPQAYAERALEQLYPSPEIVRAWEKRGGISLSKNTAVQETYRKVGQLVHQFMTELLRAVLDNFSDIRLYLSYKKERITYKDIPTELVFSPPTLVSPDLIFAGPFSYCKDQKVRTKYHDSSWRPINYFYGASIDFSMPLAYSPLSAKKSLLDRLFNALAGVSKHSADDKRLGRVTITLSQYNYWSEFPKLTIFKKPRIKVNVYTPSFLPVSAPVVEHHQASFNFRIVRHYTTPPT